MTNSHQSELSYVTAYWKTEANGHPKTSVNIKISFFFKEKEAQTCSMSHQLYNRPAAKLTMKTQTLSYSFLLQ